MTDAEVVVVVVVEGRRAKRGWNDEAPKSLPSVRRKLEGRSSLFHRPMVLRVESQAETDCPCCRNYYFASNAGCSPGLTSTLVVASGNRPEERCIDYVIQTNWLRLFY